MKRAAVLLLAFAALCPAPVVPAPPPEYVQAVEFPYYLYPRALWERELVWMKAIGIRMVEFSIPWNWHQTAAGESDFTGRTSPRRDLVGLIKLLRRLELRAWVRPLPPVDGWLNNGWPAGVSAQDIRAQRAWLKQLEGLLATQTASHGGPVAYVEAHALAIDAAAPPAPITLIRADDPTALSRCRLAMVTGRGALLWKGVEDALYPAGWEPGVGSLLRKGSVGLSGDERATVGALRRNAALLRNWGRIFSPLHQVPIPRPPEGRLPEGVSASEVTSPVASAVAIANNGKVEYHGDLHVRDPGSKGTVVIPGVRVAPGDALWLPLDVSIGPNSLCRECSHFSGAEHIVYATAELQLVEWENGILAMEFAAPQAGETVLQLARKPVGPFLAAGKPTAFDWDDRTLRAKLTIPKGNGADGHVRIGIAIEEPETSAFFTEAKRLVIGQQNPVSTAYSSEEVATRSRLRVPEGFTAVPKVQSPVEIEYQIGVPADAVHGDWANLAIEADGGLLGRAHLQLFRPASIRLMDALQIHFGGETELTPDPPTAPIDPKAGTNLELSIRNNYPGIQTFRLAASGEGLEFLPAKTELNIAAMDERRVSLRVFANDGVEGLRDWRLQVTGGATADLPMRAVLLPRGRTVAWTADLDGDGSPEWVLETQKVRAVFSSEDGGRWMEFNWKDTNLNFLPEQGAFAAPGPVEVRAVGDALEFTGKGWKRTVRLTDTTLTVEQTTPLPPDGLTPAHRGNLNFGIDRPSATSARYTVQ